MGAECCVRVAEWLRVVVSCIWLFTPYLLAIAGLLLSVFIGARAPHLFWDPAKRAEYFERPGARVFQFWLNFLGSSLGWATFILLVSVIPRIDPNGPPWVYLVLLTFALFGMAGLLPMVLSSIARGLSQLIGRYAGPSSG